MLFKVMYEFESGKTCITTFFHVKYLFQWYDVMRLQLKKAIVKTYVKGELYEVCDLKRNTIQ